MCQISRHLFSQLKLMMRFLMSALADSAVGSIVVNTSSAKTQLYATNERRTFLDTSLVALDGTTGVCRWRFGNVKSGRSSGKFLLVSEEERESPCTRLFAEAYTRSIHVYRVCSIGTGEYWRFTVCWVSSGLQRPNEESLYPNSATSILCSHTLLKHRKSTWRSVSLVAAGAALLMWQPAFAVEDLEMLSPEDQVVSFC